MKRSEREIESSLKLSHYTCYIQANIRVGIHLNCFMIIVFDLRFKLHLFEPTKGEIFVCLQHLELRRSFFDMTK